MQIRTLRPVGLALLAFALAACSDAATAPRHAAPLAPRVSPTAASAMTGVATDTSVARVTVGQYSSVTMTVNSHKIVIPAGAVCDPATSGYGPAYWNSPCALAKSVTITAKSWRLPDGRPHVEFSPDLRFAPGKTVTIYLMDRAMAADPTSVILYCDAFTCVDESIDDASLVTKRDPNGGYVYRRIKHFSGYNIAAD